MAQIFVALFLIVFGLNILLGLPLPPAVPAVLAVIAGVLVLFERYRIHIDQR